MTANSAVVIMHVFSHASAVQEVVKMEILRLVWTSSRWRCALSNIDSCWSGEACPGRSFSSRDNVEMSSPNRAHFFMVVLRQF